MKRPLPGLSLDDLESIHGGFWPIIARQFGSWMGGQATGGFGSIPNDQQEWLHRHEDAAFHAMVRDQVAEEAGQSPGATSAQEYADYFATGAGDDGMMAGGDGMMAGGDGMMAGGDGMMAGGDGMMADGDGMMADDI